MARLKDRKGDRSGRLTVIGFYELKNGKTYWECRCDCGNITITRGDKLNGKASRSCGCLVKETSRKTLKNNRNTKPPINGEHENHRNTKHGLHNTRFYGVWRDMKNRCIYKSSPDYPRYGGRGIIVSDRWRDFNNFKHDMYKSYLLHNEVHGGKNTTLDRINNDGNYELSNCRWATQQEQQANKSNSKYVNYKGEKRLLMELASEFNIRVGLVHTRLYQGWDIEKTLSTPVRYKRKKQDS